MNTLAPLHSDLLQDPKAEPGLTYCGKRIVFAGSYFDFLLYLTEQKTHLHERLGTDELTVPEALKIVNECRKPADPADVVDFSEEIQAIDRMQADIDGMLLLHTRAACIEDALQDPFIDKDTACELLDELAGIYTEIGKE